MWPLVKSGAGQALVSALLVVCVLWPSLARAEQDTTDIYHTAWLDYLVAHDCEATAGELGEVYNATLKQLRIRRGAPLADALMAFKHKGLMTSAFDIDIGQSDFTTVRPDEKVRLSNWKGC